MNNQNNQGFLVTQVFQDANPTYFAHDLDRPIRSYTVPSLYDLNHGLVYPKFGKNERFEMSM